uniref:Uncharacterized protein n=1 Tax=Chenopodium quinoa TaxID=63459 RepID=A0A803M4G6_CHEQI
MCRFGKTGIYKAFMFGSPSIIVTTPDICRKVLIDDEHFKPGWPMSTEELIGRNSFIVIPSEDHKRLRKLTAAPINGHAALSNYIEYIEDISKTTLDKERVYLGGFRKGVHTLNHGLRAMAINIPGFAYHSALKARKNLMAVLQAIIDERRAVRRDGVAIKAKRDMMDELLEVRDENGRKLSDEEIIDLLIMYLNAGHESSAHTIMWATVLVQQNPEIFQKAKDVVPKLGTFLPFGAGSRLCPGNDLAKLEFSIFLHYFLLGYRLERSNPECPVQFLPHRRPKDACLARASTCLLFYFRI